MSAKPSELTARFRRATAGPADQVAEQATLSLPIEKPRRVRFTLDMDWRQHRFLKYFALDQEVDASEVMRGLLALLEEDERVVRDLKFKLAAGKQQ